MRALIVDDEKNIRRTLLLALESMGHEAMAAASGRLAIEELKANNYDVDFLDLKLSEESGLDVLQEILRVSPRTAVVMVTAYASVETAVEAMRRGAFDYLPKPCTPIRFATSWTTSNARRSSSAVWRSWNRGWWPVDRRSTSPRSRLRCGRLSMSPSRLPQSEATCSFLERAAPAKSVLAREMHQPKSPTRMAHLLR